MATMFWETERLILRSFGPADAEDFAAYRSDPEVARYQGWEAPYSLAQAQAFIDLQGLVTPGTPGQWYQIALQLKASGQLIGDCAFRVLADTSRQAEIGFTLARAYQRLGYMTEAAGGLLNYLFETFALHRVRAICDVENTASARVLERLEMRREGLFVESTWFKGRWSSEYWYALLRREWEQLRPSRKGTP
jgi:RimJ/RimL family protein N-acetyltransferase